MFLISDDSGLDVGNRINVSMCRVPGSGRVGPGGEEGGAGQRRGVERHGMLG